MLGWQSVEVIFDLAKLMWVLRLMSLPYTSVYHQLAVMCIDQSR